MGPYRNVSIILKWFFRSSGRSNWKTETALHSGVLFWYSGNISNNISSRNILILCCNLPVLRVNLSTFKFFCFNLILRAFYSECAAADSASTLLQIRPHYHIHLNLWLGILTVIKVRVIRNISFHIFRSVLWIPLIFYLAGFQAFIALCAIWISYILWNWY